jgi:ADP-ribose pyrophosphatase YjhB (NUDIX family)
MLRRLLHHYWRFSRGITLGVRAAVLDAKGQVMLVRHGYVRGWHFPGGGVEPGETMRDALARELVEEGNVVLRGEPQLHGVFQNPTVSARDHVALFIVREFDWKGPPMPGLEIREVNFFPLSGLPEGTTTGTRRRLEEIAQRTPATPTW